MAVPSRNYRQMEAEFFRSLDHLCTAYGLPLPDVSAIDFPQNIPLAYMQVKEALQLKDKNADCIIIRDQTHSATLAVLHTYGTGHCLFYIPVKPLWNLVQTAQGQPLTEMLLSVYAYLYQVAKVPYYTENDSYLSSQYYTLQQWIDEADDDSEEEQGYKDEQTEVIDLLNHAGNHLLPLISDANHLTAWEANIQAYRNVGDPDPETESLAEQLLTLFREYPNQTVFDNIHDELIAPEETERIRAEQYISFYWSSNDCLYDTLFDMVNNDFQEYGVIDEPTAIQLFDTRNSAVLNDLGFEKRLFELIDKLCEILNKYDHD
ncbi:hypothetical protein J7E50_02935 [Pedobacter sp. ISL-68]|uniref:hypothetical protein n=1 Tax=unclassified Pedobacter TaxID=2628915 RepID=UPI001BEC1EEB|nr:MULTISPECIES: hypothetical protein [unclassified Pedobacter]MBT2560176.1 hypothetical protein [Pedobacter sp. ISL-64]MBT2589155.1 hypothetical protein [Pedobacter sp. ISL-68]